MAATPIAPTDLALGANENGRIKGSILTVWALALIGLCLRFVARRMSKAGYWYDDWLLIPAMVCCEIQCDLCLLTRLSLQLRQYASCLLFGVKLIFLSALLLQLLTLLATVTAHGLGENIYELSYNSFTFFIKGLYISEVLWTVVIFMVKYSILAFYWRLFSETRSARVAVHILLAVVTCWGFGVVCLNCKNFNCNFTHLELQVFVTVFQCHPVNGFWDLGVVATCLKTDRVNIGSSILHVITDVAILILPLPLVWKLRIERSQKATLSAVFALGGL